MDANVRRPSPTVTTSKSNAYGRGITAVIPRRRDQHPDDRRHRPLDRIAYRGRNRIERLVNRLKQARRVATRYEKRARHYVAMLTLAVWRLWL